MYKNNYFMKIFKNCGPEEDQDFGVWCECLKLDKIGLLSPGEYWFWLYGSQKLVSSSPSLLHMVAQFTFGKSLSNAMSNEWQPTPHKGTQWITCHAVPSGANC